MNIHRRTAAAVILSFVLVLGSVAGYMIIEGWSLGESVYMTAITLTTVGFGEVRPLSGAGRLFTVAVLIFGIATIGYSISAVFGYIFEGQVSEAIRLRRVRRELRKMKNHYIVCGFGDVGRVIIEEFQRSGDKFVVIDRQSERFAHGKEVEYPRVIGDASDEAVLEEAGIEHAKGLMAVLPNEQDNVFVVLTARQMNPGLTIVAKAAEGKTVRKLQKAGADRVISPAQIAGRRMVATMLRPSVVNFLDIVADRGDMAMRIEEFRLDEIRSRVVGKTLQELDIGRTTGAIVLTILDSYGTTRLSPGSEAGVSAIHLENGDRLIVLGNENQLARLEEFLAG
ncbi:MAG: potassium channel family protein [Spirochaetota bacterium]